MNILAPSPFLGWNDIYRGPARYIAIGPQLFSTGSEYMTALNYRISGDGLHFVVKEPRGDLANFTRSGVGEEGAFYPHGALTFKGLAILVGRIIDLRQVDLNHQSRNAVFTSRDGITWTHRSTPIDGEKGASGSRFLIGIAANSDRVAIIDNNGQTATSINGEIWNTGPAASFIGVDPVTCFAGNDLGFVAGGINGQLSTIGSTFSGSWTSRVSQFGTTTIDTVCAGNVFAAFGSAGKISTSGDLGTWTLRTGVGYVRLTVAAYAEGRWYAGGQGSFATSTDGLMWSPALKPWGEGAGSLMDIFYHDKWVAIMSVGRVSYLDGSIWRAVARPNLNEYASYRALPLLA